MTGEFEDPRKTKLRERCADAVDAAGYTVDPDRTPVPYPPGANLQGAIKPDVSSTEADGKRLLYFVRVDGFKALPGWLSNTVAASFSMPGVEIYVVAESIGDQLKRTCEAVGCGLLKLSNNNELDLEVEYTAPDQDTAKKDFAKEIKDVRRQLDTKLDANLQALKEQFSESRKVTEGMKEDKRSKYLDNIESMMVRWREWGDEISAELDALAGTVDKEALDAVRQRVETGTE